MNRFRSLAAVLVVTASACSSHTGGVLPHPGTGSPASAKLSIIVPRPSAATASNRRQPKYVSPSSAQLVVKVNDGPATTYGLTAQSPGCGVAVGTFSCSFSIAAPAGRDVFELTIEDTAGNALSENTVTAILTPGQSTPLSVTLAGVPAAVQLVPGMNAHVEGSATPAWHAPGLIPEPIEAEPLDADGNIIIGPGAPKITGVAVTTGSAYAMVKSAGTNDPAAYILTPVGGGAGGQTVTVSATAQGVALNDGTTTPPITTSTNFTFTPALLVATANQVNVYSAETGNQVEAYPVCASCYGAQFTSGVAGDSNGDVYIALTGVGSGSSKSSQVFYFPAGATAATTSFNSSNGVSDVRALALGKDGTLYVANGNNGPGHSPNFIEIPKGATTPSVTITGGINVPVSIGVDGSGNVYVADTAPVYDGSGNSVGSINVYGAGAQSAPSRTITSSSWSPTNVAVDAAGDFYVTDAMNFVVDYFAAGSTSPTYTLNAAHFGDIDGSAGLLLDPSGALWVSILPALNDIVTEKFDASQLPSNLLLVLTISGVGTGGNYLAWIP